MNQLIYQYKWKVMEELERFGIMPQPTTDPAMIREYLSNLYLYEIRKLKQQQVALEKEHGPQARKGYADKIVRLRQNYRLLSVPIDRWLQGGSSPRP